MFGRKMLRQGKLLFSFMKRESSQNLRYSIRISEKPLGDIFFHPRVQFLMKKLTVVDYDKIFEPRKLGVPPSTPEYVFMTEKELQNERDRIRQKAKYLLQMPPLMDVIEEKTETLSNDSSLDGHDAHHSKIIFTDISFDLTDHERIIVVREPNGLLRTANQSERQRMNQIYFPVVGRELHTPKMFEPDYLKDVLKRGDYEFILNRACMQFHPYDETYHRVLVQTFDYLNEKCDFDKLIKTRHFGPLALYLAVNKKINNMLRFFLEREELVEASFLVSLHGYVHSESPKYSGDAIEEDLQAVEPSNVDEASKIVKDFISDPSNLASDLESMFEALVHKLKERRELALGTVKGHGL